MNRRRFLTAAAGVGTAIGLAGCIGGSADSTEFDIGMSASRFRPEAFEVEVGATVVWRNTSKQGHTVTAYEGGIPDDAEYFASGGFGSEKEARERYSNRSAGVLGAGEVYEHEFTVPGTYNYFCIPHERVQMLGTIDVVEG
ncbi:MULTISPECIES: plastocyanin/azurin family copper-binding protein [Salinibaculum]|uniref:plastocyanin/azurin family copper-binding protein n=1 Tax=Salinibaculum TaxID=2732368 RepID=UPI0030CE763C